MAAIMSLVCVSSANPDEIGSFFVTVSDVEPFISHIETLVGSLDDSNPEKQHFRALAGLAKAVTNLYNRVSRFSYDIPYANVRKDLIKSLSEYRRVFLSLRRHST